MAPTSLDWSGIQALSENGDVQARFRYQYADGNTDSTHRLIFEPRFVTVGGGFHNLRVVFNNDRARLLYWNGATTATLVENTDADSLQGVWYDVFIELLDTTINVWRRGDNESDITRILSYDSLPITDTEHRRFWVAPRSSGDADFIVDDIGFDVRNMDYFLHLSLPDDLEDPSCIDTGDPNKSMGNLNGFIDFERDFNDVFRPFDIPNFNNDLFPEDEMQDPASPHDMGAKEYPMPANSSFWWANPIFD
jgi:hypothetical protein